MAEKKLLSLSLSLPLPRPVCVCVGAMRASLIPHAWATLCRSLSSFFHPHAPPPPYNQTPALMEYGKAGK